MKKPGRSTTCSRIVRSVVLGAGILGLTGCATGYGFVQPDGAGSGGYYTSDGPYTGQGSPGYASGPYYPGSFGWGDYGGYGYGPSWTFGLSLANGWGYPGYRDPWYATNWGCNGWYGCGWRHRHHHGRNPPGNPGPPRPWLKPDHPPVPPRIAGGPGPAPPVALPTRPVAGRPDDGFANRRLPGVRAVAPGDFVRAPVRQPVEAGFDRMPVQPAYVPRVPAESAFANRRDIPAMMAPRPPQPTVRPVFRPAPAPAAPVVSPPPRKQSASQARIQ